MNTKNRKRWFLLAVFLLYLIISCLITYPLILNLTTHLWGACGDTLGVVWGNWTNVILKGKTHIDTIAYPFGRTVDWSLMPGVYIINRFFTFIFGVIAGYNLIIVIGLSVTAFFTYIFFTYIGFNRIPSFIGGFIFAFTPSVIFQTISGHYFHLNFLIAIVLIALFYNKKNRSYKSALLLALAFAILVFTNIYFAYFSIFILALFVLFDISTSEISLIHIVKNYAFFGFIASIIVLISKFSLFLTYITTSSKELIETGQQRTIQELYAFSSRIYEFFVPHITHPVWGNYFQDFIRTRHPGTNLFENTLYLGFTLIIVLIISFYFLEKKYFLKKEKTIYFFFLSGFGLMIFLSFPPTIDFFGIKLPTISYFMYKIAPMFRVYARTTMLGVLFLAGVTVLFLQVINRLYSKKIYLAVCGVILVLIAFEYWHDSNKLVIDIRNVPPVYTWLAQQKQTKVIAEYPMMNSNESSFYTYLFYQRIHKKKLVNGAAPGTKAWKFFEKISHLAYPETILKLKGIKTDYVIVHFDTYTGGPFSRPLKRNVSIDGDSPKYNHGRYPHIPYGLRLVKDFGHDKVYVIK